MPFSGLSLPGPAEELSGLPDSLDFWATVYERFPYVIRPLSVLSVTLVYCGQMVGWIRYASALATLCTQLPLPQRGTATPILAHISCCQTAGCIKMKLGMEVGLGPGHIVLDGDPAPPKTGHSPPPNFRPMSVMAKRAGWIKMPLGTEVSFGPCDIVLDGDPASPEKRAQSSIFGPCLLWPNGCMY